MTTSTQRGVTLIELMVAVTISAIVLAGIIGVVTSQQRAYYDGQRQRAAQTNGRAAIIALEQDLGLAGYGMDAPLAFDFDRYSGKTNGKCPAQLDPCPRDATRNSDEIVFFYRNPRYWVPDDYGTNPAGNAWRIISYTPGASSLKVAAADDQKFRKGQILQAVCSTGAAYAYFTVGDNVTASGGLATINLTASVSSDPFQREDAATEACFGAGTARLFLIERRRYHVRPVQDGATIDPYLVLDTGVDTNGNGTIDEADELIIAEGIELLQFAYVMTSNTLAPRGTVPGTAIAFTKATTAATSGAGMTTLDFPGTPKTDVPLYGWSSYYGYAVGPPPATARLTDHQANIRAVRVALVARSPSVDPSLASGGQVPLLLNMDQLPDWIRATDRYARVTLETTVLARNMVTRAMLDF